LTTRVVDPGVMTSVMALWPHKFRR